MPHPAIRRTGRAGGLALSDGLSNVISGMGGEQDKRAYDAFTAGPLVTVQEVELAYRTTWLGRKIHDLPPFDMVRAWRNWQADAKDITALEAEETRLGLRAKARKALTLARLYGGAAMVLGAAQGNLSEALKVADLGKDTLKFVHVFNRHQITTGELETDLLSPFFDQPSWYEVQGSSGPVRIHPSRVIPFVGQPLPDGAFGHTTVDAPWGDPLLQSVRDAIVNGDLAQNGIATLIHEAKIDTLSIPNLTANLATAEYEARLIRRLQIANRAKSSLNQRVLDAEEKWETRQMVWAGMPDIIREFVQLVAAAADIPVTRLMGTSAKGLNATGEGDNDNYDEMISARQELEFRPQLERVDDLLIRSALGSRPDDVHFVFAGLKKADPKEEAEIRKSRAETAQIYASTGLVPLPAMAKATQNALVEDGSYPGLEDALKETDATVGLPIELFKLILQARKQGDAPLEMVFDRLKAAGLLATGSTFETFKAAVDEQAAAAAEAKAKATALLPKPAVEPAPAIPGQARAPTVPQQQPRRLQAANDSKPRPLYVSRRLVNTDEFLAWAHGQGFDDTLAADQLHVTITYSRSPVDWMAMGEAWTGDNGKVTISPGGARQVEALGDKGAVALLFASSELEWRHRSMIDRGASWDFPEYQPHITITYNGQGVDLAKVEPYRGPIVLGPERFEDLNEDLAATVGGGRAADGPF